MFNDWETLHSSWKRSCCVGGQRDSNWHVKSMHLILYYIHCTVCWSFIYITLLLELGRWLRYKAAAAHDTEDIPRRMVQSSKLKFGTTFDSTPPEILSSCSETFTSGLESSEISTRSPTFP